jgi:hypothetical protein
MNSGGKTKRLSWIKYDCVGQNRPLGEKHCAEPGIHYAATQFRGFQLNMSILNEILRTRYCIVGYYVFHFELLS